MSIKLTRKNMVIMIIAIVTVVLGIIGIVAFNNAQERKVEQRVAVISSNIQKEQQKKHEEELKIQKQAALEKEERDKKEAETKERKKALNEIDNVAKSLREQLTNIGKLEGKMTSGELRSAKEAGIYISNIEKQVRDIKQSNMALPKTGIIEADNTMNRINVMIAAFDEALVDMSTSIENNNLNSFRKDIDVVLDVSRAVDTIQDAVDKQK